MPFPSIVDPVVGTVITAAWEIANPLAAVRWLRQLMGNADPPGSSYVVVSSSVSSGSWAKVPSDALAPGVAVANLGYTPVNSAGDVMSGPLTAAVNTAGVAVTGWNQAAGGFGLGAQNQAGSGWDFLVSHAAAQFGVGITGPSGSFSGQVSAGSYGGGSTTAGGTVGFQGLGVGAGGISTPTISVGGGGYGGGSTTAGGTVSVQGLSVGGGGYGGGSTAAGQPSVLGVNVGVNGIAVAGIVASSRAAGAPFSVISQVQVTNLHADLLDGAHATVTPTGNAIPIADAAGKLDAWVTPSGVASIPSGTVCGYDAAIATLPSGWTRFSAADGRLLVGDGTTFSQTFIAGASYGSAWGHAHATTWASHTHSGAALSVGGSIGGPSATTAGGEATPSHNYGSDTHTHSHTLDVGGSTDAAGGGGSSTDTWLPPMRGVYWIRKT